MTLQLKLAVARVKPGEKAAAKILRDGSSKTLNVTVREVPGAEKVAKAGSKDDDNGEALKGVAVGDLDGRARQQFNIPSNVKGAVVLDVEQDSPAAEAGLKPGDVILEINRQRVAGAEDAVKLTEKPKDKATLLRIWSGGNSRFLVVDESNAG